MNYNAASSLAAPLHCLPFSCFACLQALHQSAGRGRRKKYIQSRATLRLPRSTVENMDGDKNGHWTAHEGRARGTAVPPPQPAVAKPVPLPGLLKSPLCFISVAFLTVLGSFFPFIYLGEGGYWVLC